MNCREFKSKHVGFIDDVLCAADMAAMRRHVGACARCSTLDIRIRRSLMVIRNLPQIEPSAEFYPRLLQRLQNAPAPSANQHASSVATTFVVVTAALAAAVYFAMAVGVHRQPSVVVPARVQTLATRLAPIAPRAPLSNPELVPAVPAGVPVWPAMFMVGELPMHLTNVDLLENGVGR
jgi:hypothetical protein